MGSSAIENVPTIGGQMATRPLHFIWIVDCSGSMAVEGKIQSLNNAIREAIPHMQKVADENPNAQVLIRAIRFSSGAQWHIAQPVPVEDFRWDDLKAGGVTDLGKALKMLAEQLSTANMPDRALPPVLVLISDGRPDNFKEGLQQLMDQPWGKKSVRVAISIGSDADDECLTKFIGNLELKPLKANTPEMLVKHIRWVSTTVQKAASQPSSQVAPAGTSGSNVPLPPPPSSDAAVDDVW